MKKCVTWRENANKPKARFAVLLAGIPDGVESERKVTPQGKDPTQRQWWRLFDPQSAPFKVPKNATWTVGSEAT